MPRLSVLLSLVALIPVGCASLQHTDPPQVTIVGVEPASGEGLEARMLLKLRVQNPNSTPLDYNGTYVELDVLGKSFGSGVSSESGTVPAFGEAVIGVPITISVMGILGQAMGMMGGGKTPDKVTYEMRGKLNSPALGALRFKSQGELTLPSSLPATSDVAQ